MSYPARPCWTAWRRANVAAKALCAKYTIGCRIPDQDKLPRVEDMTEIILESTGLNDLVCEDLRRCWSEIEELQAAIDKEKS